jgi:hypothetical protein
MLIVDWAPHHDGDRVMFVFDGGGLSPDQLAAISLRRDELRSFRFVAAEQLEQMTSDRLARRFRAALAARVAGQTLKKRTLRATQDAMNSLKSRFRSICPPVVLAA